MKVLRHDADDLPRFAVDGDRVPNDGAVRAEFAVPVVVSQNHGIRTAGRNVLAIEHASQHGGDAEDRKNAVGHIERLQMLRLGDAGYADRIAVIETDILEMTVLLAINEVV